MEGYDYGARYYLPQMGTWMSADSETPDNVGEFNGFQYVASNPLSYRDPTGHSVLQREIVWMCLRWPTLHASATSALLHRAVVVPQRAPSRCPPDLPERGPRSHKRETAPLPAGVLGSGRA